MDFDHQGDGTVNELKQKLDEMSPAHVLEAGMMILPKVIGLDDPKEAPALIARLAGLPASEIPKLDELAHKTETKSADEIVSLLRMVVLDVADEEGDGERQVEHQIDQVGRRQVVISPDFYYISALLIAGYLAWKTGGRKGETKTTTIEEDKTGRKKITIRKKTEFLNPFDPLAKLLDLITKGST
jgi:hypothetical protein